MLLGMMSSVSGSAIAAVVSQDFTSVTTLPSWLDVSGITGNRMMYDSTGKLTYAPNNTLTQSNAFNTASWGASACSVAAAAVTAPDNSTNSWTLTDNATNTSHRLYSNITVTATGPVIIASIYAKQNTLRYLCLNISNTGNVQYSRIFDLQTGALGSQGTFNSPTGTGSGIVDAGNGWWRLYVYMNVIAGNTPVLNVYTSDTSSNLNASGITPQYAGTSQSAYIFGAQLENVTYQTTPSAYVPTTTSAYYGPRFDYDPNTLAARGLLIEESRANINTQSDNFAAWIKAGTNTVVSNTTTSPDGTQNADKLVTSTANDLQAVYAGVTFTAASYSFSAYAKAAGYNFLFIRTSDTANRYTWFDLSNGTVGTKNVGHTATITNVGNGWYRCSVSWTAGAAAGNVMIGAANADNANVYVGDGTSGIYAFGAQTELGAFPTSYIPTTTASVTRVADIIKLSGSALTAVQGANQSVILEYSLLQATTLNVPFSTAPVSAGAYISYKTDPVVGWSTAVSSSLGTITTAPSRIAGGWAGTAFSASYSGGTIVSGTSDFTGTGVTSAQIGNRADGASLWASGWYRGLSIYNQRLSNATLQAKSVVGSAY